MTMKISDEIRKWCAAHDGTITYKGDFEKLCALADRIDKETVELPCDREGVRIHVGDTMWGYMTGRKMTVTTLSMRDSGWYVFTDKAGYVKVSHLTHAQPDSLERIADELEELSESNRINGSGEMFYRAGDLAARIRRLADKEAER